MFIAYGASNSQAPSERHVQQNDEIRMPKLEGMTKCTKGIVTPPSSSFVLCASLVIRHSSFVIYSHAAPNGADNAVCSHNYKHGAPTALKARSRRKSEILRNARCSSASPISTTENLLPVSFSIDVIATSLMPQGTM
jgi:hypothetical protein